MQTKYNYRITSYDNQGNDSKTWETSFKAALKTQKQLYADGAERVEIVKEYYN